jgi:hypothetical protein
MTYFKVAHIAEIFTSNTVEYARDYLLIRSQERVRF